MDLSQKTPTRWALESVGTGQQNCLLQKWRRVTSYYLRELELEHKWDRYLYALILQFGAELMCLKLIQLFECHSDSLVSLSSTSLEFLQLLHPQTPFSTIVERLKQWIVLFYAPYLQDTDARDMVRLWLPIEAMRTHYTMKSIRTLTLPQSKETIKHVLEVSEEDLTRFPCDTKKWVELPDDMLKEPICNFGGYESIKCGLEHRWLECHPMFANRTKPEEIALPLSPLSGTYDENEKQQQQNELKEVLLCLEKPNWNDFQIGDIIDCQEYDKWYETVIRYIERRPENDHYNQMVVHFTGLDVSWDTWIPCEDPSRIAMRQTHSKGPIRRQKLTEKDLYYSQWKILEEMGFDNFRHNADALRSGEGSLEDAIEALLA